MAAQEEEPKLDIFKLVKFGAPKKFEKSRAICMEGTFGREMYIVLKGSVDVLIGGVHLATLKSGSFFGEMSLLGDLPRSATCKTAEETYLLILTKDNFGQVIKEEPLLAFKIMQVMAERIRKLNTDIKLATKQIAKSSKSFNVTAKRSDNDVLEVAFYEGMLHKSLKYPQYDCINKILELSKGELDINCKDGYGKTPLLIAVTENHDDMTADLIKRGAAPEQVDLAGNTAIIIASINGKESIVRKLLDRGINVNARNANDETALMYAAIYGHLDIMKLLIEEGADLYKRDMTGNSVLGLAALYGQEESVKLLLTHSPNVNNADKFGFTALHHALRSGNESVAVLLIQAGGNMAVKDKYAQTPMMIAKEKNLGWVLTVASKTKL
jgi:ankyrin repeat protein